ncbi:MAG: class IV adenylate cyclase [Bacteroidota bacterium]|nr:class IV adenylate cyclase [Bacteroidota bacterium]
MKITNFEFKTRSKNIELLETKLLKLDPVFKGEDHQVDTYFNIEKGRLKLREGNIENSLIYYERKDVSDTKQSDVLLYQFQPDLSLKEILTKVHGIKVIVDKRRKIYFIDNVKFHFDTVDKLGTFVEVEAIDTGNIGIEKLKEQCKYYADFFGIHDSDYEAKSYSDLMLQLSNKVF